MARPDPGADVVRQAPLLDMLAPQHVVSGLRDDVPVHTWNQGADAMIMYHYQYVTKPHQAMPDTCVADEGHPPSYHRDLTLSYHHQ